MDGYRQYGQGQYRLGAGVGSMLGGIMRWALRQDKDKKRKMLERAAAAYEESTRTGDPTRIQRLVDEDPKLWEEFRTETGVELPAIPMGAEAMANVAGFNVPQANVPWPTTQEG